MQLDPKCSLCLSGDKSHSHLFFSCGYAQQIWCFILLPNGTSSGPMDLVGALSWIRVIKNTEVATPCPYCTPTVFCCNNLLAVEVEKQEGFPASMFGLLFYTAINQGQYSSMPEFLERDSNYYPLLLLGSSIRRGKISLNVLGV